MPHSFYGVAPNYSQHRIPEARLKLLTDGGEDASAGPCSGPDDSDGVPPFDAASWQGKAFNGFFQALDAWSVDLTIFLPKGGDSGVDPETGRTTSPAQAAFFSVLPVPTGGSFTGIADDAPISPLVSR